MSEPLDLWTPPDARRAVAKVERLPRSYQSEVLSEWRANRGLARGQLGVLFTGGGKTFIAAQVAKAATGRVLFAVNRNALGQQSIAKLREDTGARWEMEQADQWATVGGTAHVVTLIQTLMQPKRFERFGPDAFSDIIVDEVHRFMAPRYRRPLEFFTGARILGLTATPDGAKKGFKPLLTAEAWKPRPLNWAQANAWSTPFDFQPYETDVSLDGVAWKKGDFDQKDLDLAMVEAAAQIARAAVEKCDDLRTLVFCPGVKTVVAAVDAINKLKHGSARALYGELDAREGKGTKDRNIAEHKAGKFQYLVSCDMIREAYDDEYVTCLLIAKPMTKRYDFEQVVGRGSRLWPKVGDILDMEERRAAIAASPKPVCRVIDLSCVSLKHELVGPVDVLGGDYTAKEKEKAKKILKDAGGGDPLKALEKARADIARRAAAAQAAKDAKVHFRPVKRKAPKEPPVFTPTGEVAASTGARARLDHFGIPNDEFTTKDQAGKLLRREFLAQSKGWCDYRQREFLQTWVGVRSAWAIPAAKGKALAEAWRCNGKQRLSPEQIRAVISI